MSDVRAYDLVLCGATGFTGGLTAEYLAAHGEAARGQLRWALAGRSQDKLQAVRERLVAIDSALADMDVIEADAADPAAMRTVAESTRAVLSTVGPFIEHGAGLVAACAAAGTDYVDSTGEPEFVDRMWLAHHATAERTGARLVHACGFDSIPADLGTLFTVSRLPEGVPLRVEAFVRAGGSFSGGTYHSAVRAAGRLRQGQSAAAQRRRAEGSPADGRAAHGLTGPPRRSSAAGGWAVPMPVLDPQIVLRSARALPRYGPDFAYGHYMGVSRLTTVAALAAGAGALVALAAIPPARAGLLKLRAQGEGPDAATRERARFRVRFVGRPEGGDPIVCEVSGGDPGYTETAKMLGESALCLLGDDLPSTAGQVTTAVAMGDALIARLTRAGIGFVEVPAATALA